MKEPLSRRAILASLCGAPFSGCLNFQEAGQPSSTQSSATERDRETRDQSTTQQTTEEATTERETTTNQVELSEMWAADISSRHFAVGSDRVYAAHPDDYVIALDRASGEEQWRSLGNTDFGHVDGYLPSIAVIAPGSVTHVLGRDNDGDEYALFRIAETGDVVERRPLDRVPMGMMMTSDGLMLDLSVEGEHEVSREYSTSHCDYAGGAVEWLDSDLRVTQSIDKPDEACRFDLLDAVGSFALFDGAFIRGFDATTGTQWKRELYSDGGVVQSDGGCFLITLNEGLLRLNPGDGSTVWQFDQYAGGRGIAAGDETVYLAGAGLSAIRTADGTRRWRQSINGTPVADPVVTADGVWVLTEQEIVLFDTVSGELYHRSPSPAMDRHPRLFADEGQVLVTSTAGARVFQVQ